MRQRLVLFCYTFALGIAAAMFMDAPFSVVWPCYIAAAVSGLVAIGLGVAQDQGVSWIAKWAVLVAVVFCAVPFGYGRYAERSYVAPFDANAPDGNHIRAILEAFPDAEITSTTRFVGKIVAEPEYRPAQGKPGVIALTIDPYEVEPEPGTGKGKVYPCSGGSIVVYLRPSKPFGNSDRDFSDMFTKLSDLAAYGYIVEINAQLQTFNSADNPGLFDNESINTDRDVYAQATIPFWDFNRPPIKIIEEADGNPMVEIALNLKQRMLGVIKASVPFPESAFLAGVTLGSRRGLDGVRTIFEPAPEKPANTAAEDPSAESDVPDLRQYILDQFRWSGTSHVLAVSGLHVTIIAGALWGLFMLLRLPPKVYAPLIVLGLTTFCLITGAAPSSTRAVIMNSLVVLSFVYLGQSFKASLMQAIGVAAFIILVQNPKWLIQPSFSLSFMAVISLGLLTPPCERVLSTFVPGWKKMPNWVQQFIAAQGSIQLGMMGPLSAYYFCRMSLAGPFANFIAIPLIGIIVQLGIFACVLGMIPYVGLYLAVVLNAANYIAIWFFLWVAHFSTVVIPFPFVQTFTPRMILGYYALLSLFVYSRPLLRYTRIFYYDLVMGIGGVRRRLQCLGALGGAFAVIAAVTVYSFWPPVPDGKLHVNVLSVRYGQSIHIQTPSGAQILIDAGPWDYRTGWNTGEKTVALYLLKQRIGRLDEVIMTNTSPEDFGGLPAIFKIFPVRRFFSTIPIWQWDTTDDAKFQTTVSKAIGNDVAESPRNSDFDDATFLLKNLVDRLHAPWGIWRFFELLPLSPTSVITDFRRPECFEARAGMVLWSEDAPGGKFELLALHPSPDYPLKPTNNNSLVLMIRYGKTRILLPSDITEEGIRELMRVPANLLVSDVMIVPAHGSAKSDIEQFFATVLPPGGPQRYAIMSTGWSSGMKPPPSHGRTQPNAYRDSFLSHRQMFVKDVAAAADNTAQGLERMGVIVARTDRHGAVLMTSDGVKLDISTVMAPLEKKPAAHGDDQGTADAADDVRQRENP